MKADITPLSQAAPPCARNQDLRPSDCRPHAIGMPTPTLMQLGLPALGIQPRTLSLQASSFPTVLQKAACSTAGAIHDNTRTRTCTSKTLPRRTRAPHLQPSTMRNAGQPRLSNMHAHAAHPTLAAAHKQTASGEILLWMTPSEAPKALQASECSELLDPMRANCWISAQH